MTSAAICALFAALFAVRYAVSPYPVEGSFTGGMPLAAALAGFSISRPWLAAACAAVAIVWTTLLVVQLSIRYTPASNRNYLPPQIFLAAAAGIAVPGEALAAYLAAWLVALSARSFVSSFQKGYRFTDVFRAGFSLGFIPLLYAPAVVVVPLLAILVLWVYRRSGREFVVCLAGMLLPLPAAGFIYWAAGEPAGFIYREVWRCTFLPLGGGAGSAAARGVGMPPSGLIPVSAAVAAVVVLALAFVAIAWSLNHKKALRKTHYKFISHVALTLVLTLASAALPGTSATLVPITAVGIALSVPYAFSGKSTPLASAIYFLVLATVLALNLFPVLGVSLP